MPFSTPWTRLESPAFERSFLQYHWHVRADWKPDEWELALAVFLDGEPSGSQSLRARSFRLLRLVSTGSWLEQAHQGAGIGKEMRAAVLELAFRGLAAEV